MEQEYIGLKYDVVFKAFFTNKDNEDLLINFISSILDIPLDSISSVKIKNPEISLNSFTDKFSRLDLNLKVDDKNVNVEMQVCKQEYYKERSVFYWSCLYDDLRQGESYGEIPDAIAVHILDHKLFDCEEYQSSFTFMEKTRHEILTNKCAIHYFELPKMNEALNVKNRKELWLQLIKATSRQELTIIEELGDEVMSKAVQVVYGLQGDEKVREEARMRRKAQNDMYNDLAAAEKKGLLKGIVQGIAQGRETGRAEGRAEGEQIGLQRGEQIGLQRGEQIGLQRGEQIGLQRGEQIGLQRGIAEVLAKMKIAGYSQADIDKILNADL